jgi:predicted DNA-binding protein (MmcQ/YjbR family)
MGRKTVEPSPDLAEALQGLRRICATLPDCAETVSFGNPAFRRGAKAFAVLDRYKGRACLWVRVSPARRGALLSQEGWFASPYDPHETALCCRLDALDWGAAPELIEASYALARA